MVVPAVILRYKRLNSSMGLVSQRLKVIFDLLKNALKNIKIRKTKNEKNDISDRWGWFSWFTLM